MARPLELCFAVSSATGSALFELVAIRFSTTCIAMDPTPNNVSSNAPSNLPGADGKSCRTIELEVRETRQLFNSMDPSPFRERDLDASAEEFIESWAREFPAGCEFALRVHVEQWPAEDPTELIRDAVHNYFAYRARQDDLEFRRLMQEGRTSLMIGLVFLACCLLVIKILAGSSTDTWAGVLRESLTIAGWVAMWRPMQIYLYDWWPVRRRGRMQRKLSLMPVEVVSRAQGVSGV